MTSYIYSVVSITVCLSLHVVFAVPVSAKDRPPEPIEDPGECPIDAPLRVADMRALRQFEGLIGHCPEIAIIESPAFRANLPRAHSVTDEQDPEGLAPWQISPEKGPRDADFTSVAKDDNGPRAIASRDGSQVAIRPGASAWELVAVPTEPSESEAPENETGLAIKAGSEPGDADAILSLGPRSYSTAFDQTIAEAARQHRVDPLLLHAVIKQESAYKATATSHAGARGLMQVMPGTGRMLGVRDASRLYDPRTNVDAGAKLLSQLWHRFDGNIDLVLAAYNAGEGAVRKYGNAIPPYRETQDYVVKVKANYQQLAAESGLAVNF